MRHLAFAIDYNAGNITYQKNLAACIEKSPDAEASFYPIKLFERDGVWSFFRLLDTGSVLRQGDNIGLTLAAGGRQVGYSFGVGSLKNPLILPALREIRCPTGI